MFICYDIFLYVIYQSYFIFKIIKKFDFLEVITIYDIKNGNIKFKIILKNVFLNIK